MQLFLNHLLNFSLFISFFFVKMIVWVSIWMLCFFFLRQFGLVRFVSDIFDFILKVCVFVFHFISIFGKNVYSICPIFGQILQQNYPYCKSFRQLNKRSKKTTSKINSTLDFFSQLISKKESYFFNNKKISSCVIIRLSFVWYVFSIVLFFVSLKDIL